MDYSTGEVRYGLDKMVARLGISRPTIKRHIAVLRELGALAWVVHGTKTNIRRALGLKGYAGTATVYAAVIPPVYDHAMGHRIIGSGYAARAVAQRPEAPVDNPGADKRVPEAYEPPSLTVAKEEGKLKVEGGSKNTSRKRATCLTASIPRQKSKSSSKKRGATGRSPMQVARDIQIARHVRARVNWTQREGLRRLAFALRPYIDRSWDPDEIVAELASMCLTWRPAAPAAFLRTEFVRRAQAAADLEAATAVYELENPTEGTFSVSSPHLIADVLAANALGMARYSARMAEQGWDDLSGAGPADAAADFASWLGGN
ncbi:hypothetical protein [Streptomyces sp. NPDC058745]|uniref:hypothetical protein n=1 Tax=Streptomyces sp. NPDC058745 TaxID=3346621 RepID=UPI0036967436